MELDRKAGVVLHLTSLPSRWGIGDMGPEAYRFVDFLRAAGQTVWQVMPLGPTGYGDSPYQCFSAFAGNPLLISPDLLAVEGLLGPDDLGEVPPSFPDDKVQYSEVIPWKEALLTKAYERFEAEASDWDRTRFERFRELDGVRPWLTDYALFRALKEAHGGAEWTTWDPALRRRDPEALAAAAATHARAVRRHEFLQWLFFTQWNGLRDYARLAGVRFMGDAPIFVAHDSADAWSHQDLFHLDAAGKPEVVAGVPPDYFSATGQLWGNPLYDWEAMEAEGFGWWISRLRTMLSLVDVVRLDHFRGFQAYWEVPGGDDTAMNGRWVEAPGEALFEAMKKALGNLPIVAEDLGVITPEVEALRDQFEFPGMKVLQFAFGGDPDDEYLPHNHIPRAVVYSGTHDNDTTQGWWDSLDEATRARVKAYTGGGADPCGDLIRLAFASVGALALVPMQDHLRLGAAARMNVPGAGEGNWSWRFRWEDVPGELAEQLAQLTRTFGRA